jgi:hypothetical protein
MRGVQNRLFLHFLRALKRPLGGSPSPLLLQEK